MKRHVSNDRPSAHAAESMDSQTGAERRLHERFALAVQAAVTIPLLPTVNYGVCELSKTGMFLAFTNADTTKQLLIDHQVSPGTELHIAFSVPVGGRKLHCELPAEIARINEYGIAVRFLTNDPSELSDLIDAFAASHRLKRAAG